ncbi:import inner membrane translocase subunit tim-21 [Microdochium trichocladiopsis]|uniref:Mitochondrial import inner membrane translocase subunit Tim21 n=1 Tax=Microdochium trichocladiopsis TaxID=1682393 RepID=A0A9P8YEE1_9PEZI|nr:import inner membrane translocase subunit tim-21 [Microdochium trichocladiopsis]KAH7035493.1 import inner membrane translocase subunit tim-21 [Microdochium trichocladiopsis]
MTKLLLRPLSEAVLAPHLRQAVIPHRSYATTTSGKSTSAPGSKRRSVTPFNDNGHVPWSELSAGEKAGRATQQSFNFGMVLVGIAMTGGVGYLLYTDVFSPDSKTAYFNRAVDRIKKDPDCVGLLGDAKQITAHGEETANKWRRARPIASTLKNDPQGNQHLQMHFYVHGPLNSGTVSVHLIKRVGSDEFKYKYFFVDVKGHSRIYLENADAKTDSGDGKFKLFGVNWK